MCGQREGKECVPGSSPSAEPPSLQVEGPGAGKLNRTLHTDRRRQPKRDPTNNQRGHYFSVAKSLVTHKASWTWPRLEMRSHFLGTSH